MIKGIKIFKNHLFVLMCFLFLFPIMAKAEELPPGIVIGDNNGLNATKNGQYHVNVNNVMPGKSWHTTISIINMEKDIPYSLSMLIEPSIVSGKLDLSNELEMIIHYDGEKIYQGPASGIGSTKNLQNTPIDLGVFKAGDSRALDVEYSLSGKFTNQDFEQKNTMTNVWTYSAVKEKKITNTPDTPDNSTSSKYFGKLPSTGEIREGIIIFCLGLFFLMTTLLILKKIKYRN